MDTITTAEMPWPHTPQWADLELPDLCAAIMHGAARFAFDGYSLIRCVILSELLCAWLHGAAGDGMTWRTILQHLEECDECHP